jgi:hypothetical protein
MDRRQVNQRLLDLFQSPSYLEVGVWQGDTFHAVNAARKVAVDPDFQFDVAAAQADPANDHTIYHATTSDDYFTRSAGRDDRFDLIFLDGLHTLEQTLRDLLHAIDRLNDGGVIVIDDVLPSSYGASLSDLADAGKYRRMADPQGSRAWMGDVFRLVFFVRDYLASYSYATITDNHGQMILWRQTREHDVPTLTVEQISRLEYKDVVFRPRAYNFMPFDEVEARIAAWREQFSPA